MTQVTIERRKIVDIDNQRLKKMIKKILFISILSVFTNFALLTWAYGEEAKPVPCEEKSETILLKVPDVRQSTTYSCGASCLQGILMYWGIEHREGDLIVLLNTSPDSGTDPEDIVRVAVDKGLKGEIKDNLTLEELELSIKDGIPVIVAIQAWRDEQGEPWEKVWEDGHYVIVTGFDEKNIYFEDPSLLGSKGFIEREEFLSRWHDYSGDPPLDEKDRKYIRIGIFIKGEKPAPPPELLHID